jgi:hypothetical protein
MTATTDLQKGLNEVVMNKVHRMIDGKAAGVQATMERLTSSVGLLKQESKEVEKILMRNDPEDGVQGGATLWKLTQAITAHARELTPERSRELHELSGQLMNRVKLNK